MIRLNLSDIRLYVSSRTTISTTLIGQLGWTTTGYFAIQVIRFGQSVILTHLLAPSLFGAMIVLYSLRFGVELFTDIGISQNLVASKNGWDPRFYSTAWTLQIIRGVLLAILFFFALPLASRFYGDKTLDTILPVLCIFFVLAGAHSIGPILAAKALDTKRTARYEILGTVFGSICTIGAAVVSPNLWGLVAGNLLSTIAVTVLSYFIWPNVSYRLILDRTFVRQIIMFGRWIFLSSIVYFLASNFDRLALGKFISLGMLGIYGIARSLGDILGQFALRLGDAIVFPLIASADLEHSVLREKIARRRFQFLILFSIAASIFISLSDVAVHIIYDRRYALAGVALPWVGLATWLFILNTFSDSVMLGVRKPSYGAIGNVTKFAVLIVMLPWAALRFGIMGAAFATAIAEFSRYVVLLMAQIRERIHFVRQDVCTTAAMLLGAIAIRAIAHACGVAGPAGELFIFAAR